MPPSKPKLVVVGWRDADWPLLHSLAASSALPNLAQMIQSGIAATLAAPDPLVEVALWTTLATGMRSDRHGVNHATEIRPDLGGVQPTGRRSWAAPPFWIPAEAAGYRTTCVNWPATSPATRWPGRHVDEFFKVASGRDALTWPVPRHSVSPDSLKPALRRVRVHSEADLAPHLAALLPPPGALDALSDAATKGAARLLAGVMTVHETALRLAARTDWEVFCVCYDPLVLRRASSHTGLGGDAHMVRAAAIMLDLMLGQLLSFVPRQASVFIVSPSGFDTRSAHLHQRRREGLLVAAGPDVAKAALPGDAQLIPLVNVAPSLLARLGICTGCDGDVVPALAGSKWSELVSAPGLVWTASAPSAPPSRPDALTSPQQHDAMRRTAAAGRLHHAQSLIARGQLSEAAGMLAEADRLWPHSVSILKLLAHCRPAETRQTS